MVINILIVDDEPLVRTGLEAILSSAEDLRVVGQAVDGRDAVEQVRALRPDVVFMDLHMPRMNGNEATQAIRALPDPPEVVVLTSLNADDTCIDALAVGACSFVVKASPNEDLIRAARSALTDEPFYSPAAARAMRAGLPPRVDSGSLEAFDLLTPREQQIGDLLRDGLSNREISTRLYVSEGTVKAHINQMLTRLGLSNRTQLAVLADRVLR